MSVSLSLQKLTPEQENYVWRWICGNMTDADKNPFEVIQQDFGGDRGSYLLQMANWHGIKFCAGCSMPRHREINQCKCPAYQI